MVGWLACLVVVSMYGYSGAIMMVVFQGRDGGDR